MDLLQNCLSNDQECLAVLIALIYAKMFAKIYLFHKHFVQSRPPFIRDGVMQTAHIRQVKCFVIFEEDQFHMFYSQLNSKGSMRHFIYKLTTQKRKVENIYAILRCKIQK